MKYATLLIISAFTTLVPAQAQQEPIDYDIVNRITDEGFNRSEVMESLTHLTDVIGPRLTNSPGMREAANWSRDQFVQYGLKNAQLEPFPFGRGWSFESSTVIMTEPRVTQLQAMPISWHPGTNGTLSGEVFLAPMEDEKDFKKYKGKLKGKIVLLSKERERAEPSNTVFTRLTDQQLSDREVFSIPDRPTKGEGRFEKFIAFGAKLDAFLVEEGALAMARRSRKEAGLLAAEGYLHRRDNSPQTPAVTIASEDYDRLVRLLDRDEKVSLSIDVIARFHDDDVNGQNVWAEIPGRGSRPEIVIAGAHLDSWFMGDGAVDNAAGSAIVMEAARILSTLNVRPKRTIRFALWDGEEQGLYGSVHHVEKHFAARPDIDDEERRKNAKYFWLNESWPVQKKRDFERFSAYFNLDNGSGKIRGINGEGNAALQPIFEQWFKPFHEYGAKTVALRRVGGTDHLPFQAMGLPGFQFIQDPLDYGSRLHHSHIDTASHVYEKDLQQAAIIMASVLWHAANRDERLPRMPVPTEPNYKEEPEEEPEIEDSEEEISEEEAEEDTEESTEDSD